MKTVLVTGGAGAIGSQLVRRLSLSHRVLVLDDLSSGFLDNLQGLPVTFRRASVADDAALRELFAERPALVFHLAARFANQRSIEDPRDDLSVNGLGTLKILQCALEVGVERFVYTSSSSVYTDAPQPRSETAHDLSSQTPYAITKFLGEQYVRFFHRHYGLPAVALRLFNSYGPGEYPGLYRNVIPNFFYRALRGEPLIITGTGDETRDFTYVDDTITAILLAAARTEAVGKTFNVGTGTEVRIGELAELIREISGTNSTIAFHPRRRWDRVSRRRADITLISQTLGFQPAVDLRTGLKRTHDWFLENQIAARQWP